AFLVVSAFAGIRRAIRRAFARHTVVTLLVLTSLPAAIPPRKHHPGRGQFPPRPGPPRGLPIDDRRAPPARGGWPAALAPTARAAAAGRDAAGRDGGNRDRAGQERRQAAASLRRWRRSRGDRALLARAGEGMARRSHP